MTSFKIRLNLHNIKSLKTNKYIDFFKILAYIIEEEYNIYNKMISKYTKNVEPSIKIKSNYLITSKGANSKDNSNNSTNDNTNNKLIAQMFPPYIEITIKLKMSAENETRAFKEFYFKNKKTLVRDKAVIKSLYYSTKISNIIIKIKNYITNGIYWDIYKDMHNCKTRYVPNITLSNATVLSL